MKRWPPKCNMGYPCDPAAPAKSSFTSFVGEVIVHVLKECYKTWPTVEMRRRSDESKELALLMAAGGGGACPPHERAHRVGLRLTNIEMI